MPGLIDDPAYVASRARIIRKDADAEKVFDAIEWALLCATKLDEFELITHTIRGPLYVCRVPKTDTTPCVVVAFVVETFRNDEKWLLLDAELEDGLKEQPRKVLRRKSTME